MTQPEEFITVFSSGDKAAVAMAKMILDGSGIKYQILNDKISDLFTYGQLGTGFSPLIGPVRIRVIAQDADVVRELLSDIDHPRPQKLPLALQIFAIILLAAILGEIIYAIVNVRP